MTIQAAEPPIIQVKRISHKGQDWIGLFFKFHERTKAVIKSLPDRRFSITNRCWYLPYTKAAFRSFLQLGLSYQLLNDDVKDLIKTDIETNIGTSGDSPPTRVITNIKAIPALLSVDATKESPVAADIFSWQHEKLKIEFNNNLFIIEVPYQKDIVGQLRMLDRAWWSSQHRRWVVHGSLKNLYSLQALFDIWTVEEYSRLEHLIKVSISPKRVTLYRIPETDDQVAIKATGFGLDLELLKSLPQRQYQQAYKRWIVPHDQQLIDRLVAHYQANGTQVINRLPVQENVRLKESPSLADRQARLMTKFAPEHQELVHLVTDRLIQLRYSWQTVKAYVGPIVKFKKWLGDVPLNACEARHVNAYLANLAKEKVSESLIHKHVNGIKFYFEKVVFNTNLQIDQIKRPKRSLTLPKVLSTNEVSRMITHTKNLKHKTILYVLYSSGLRLSEVINLKLEHVQWDRQQIFVCGGKGKKDRVVMLSDVLKEALRVYCNQYKPIHYVFEGASGNSQYSSSSIQQVVKTAAKRAHISQKVTPHTLRHCFATHLHDGGTSIKLIQELLGHADIKTTLIYTHVSKETVLAVQSPLDKMNLIKKPINDIEKLGI